MKYGEIISIGGLQNSGSTIQIGSASFDSQGRPAGVIGTDVFFFVSGSVSGSGDEDHKAVFGGDVVVSGAFTTSGGDFSVGGDVVDIEGNLNVTGDMTVTGTFTAGGGEFAIIGDVIEITGSLTVTQGISGSLTTLSDGTSYLIAGANVTIVSESNGAVTISSTGGGGGGIFTISGGEAKTTSSVSFDGSDLYPSEHGADVFFYVSGTVNVIGEDTSSYKRRAVIASDTVVSGTLTQGIAKARGQYSVAFGGSSAGCVAFRGTSTAGYITLDSGYGDVTAAFPSSYAYVATADDSFNTYKVEVSSVSWSSPNTVLTLTDPSFVASYSSVNVVDSEELAPVALGADKFEPGSGAVSMGITTKAVFGGSHAEGGVTEAIGVTSHAEGLYTQAIGKAAHAEGSGSIAIGPASHAAGINTVAAAGGQTAIGRYNLVDNFDSLFVVGDGTDEGTRSDVLRVNFGGAPGSGHVQVTGSLSVTNAFFAGGDVTDIDGSLFVTKDVGISGSLSVSGSVAFDPLKRSAVDVGTDVYFFVSGSMGGKDAPAPGVAVFGGDVVISGTLLGGSPLKVAGEMTMSGTFSQGSGSVALGKESAAFGKASRSVASYAHAEGNGTTAGAAYNVGISGITSGVIKLDYTGGDLTSFYTPGDKILVFGESGFGAVTTVAAASYDGVFTSVTGSAGFGSASYNPAVGEAGIAVVNYTNDYKLKTGDKGSGESSHVEGKGTIALGNSSHAEGEATIAIGERSHSEGYQTRAFGIGGHAEGRSTFAVGEGAHAEGKQSAAFDSGGHAEGYVTRASGRHFKVDSVSSGVVTLWSPHGDVSSDFSTSGEIYLLSYGMEDKAVKATYSTPATWDGTNTVITLDETITYSAAHLVNVPTPNTSSAVNVFGIVSETEGAHAEGYNTWAYSQGSHAEGVENAAFGWAAHVEGRGNAAMGHFSHAEGSGTIALGLGSHAGGIGTIASGTSQTVVGQYNSLYNDTSLFVVGNGAEGSRSDVFRVEAGSAQVTGSLYTSGSATFDSLGRSAADVGTDVYFFVSGTISGTTGDLINDKKAVFGGDVVISGSLSLLSASSSPGTGPIGTARLTAGTATVYNSLVKAGGFSLIFLTKQENGTAASVSVSSINDGDFTITSSSGSDADLVAYLIINSAGSV